MAAWVCFALITDRIPHLQFQFDFNQREDIYYIYTLKPIILGYQFEINFGIALLAFQDIYIFIFICI